MVHFQFDTAPKVYKSTGDYVTGLYNPKMASRLTKKDAGTSMHHEQRLDLTEKYVVIFNDWILKFHHCFTILSLKKIIQLN